MYDWDNEQPQSYLAWMFDTVGPFYTLLLLFTGAAVFLGACLASTLSRRPSVLAAYLPFVPLPLLIGVLATLQGLVAGYLVISSSGAIPKYSEIAALISSALFCSLVGLLLTLPSYLVLAIGLFFRTLAAGDKRPHSS